MSPDAAPDLGTILRGLRVARGLGLDGASLRSGVGKSTLSAWENGKSRPRGAPLVRLLDALEADHRTRARLLHAADPLFARVELAHSPLGAPVDVGLIVRTMRERCGLTQADLARQAGVTQGTVARWESGEFTPPAETVHALGFALGASPEETVALASAQGTGGAGGEGFPDEPAPDPERAWRTPFPEALREVVSLGLEADLWRRAARDPRWDASLVRILAERAHWLVLQERYDEVAAPARRAISMAKTTEGYVWAAYAVAALADHDRHFGRGHAAAAEMAGAWAEALPNAKHWSWMLHQRGLCLARMGQGDQGAALAARATQIDDGDWVDDHWGFHTNAQCEIRLAAGEAAKAAALIDGRREGVDGFIHVRVEHGVGRAASDAEIAALRHQVHHHNVFPLVRRRLERIERRQARLSGRELAPYVPEPVGPETDRRL